MGAQAKVRANAAEEHNDKSNAPLKEVVSEYVTDAVEEEIYSHAAVSLEPVAALVSLVKAVQDTHLNEIGELSEQGPTPMLKGNMREIFKANARLDPSLAFKAPTPLMAPGLQRFVLPQSKLRDEEQEISRRLQRARARCAL